jgi:hypothetical protein
VEAIVVLLPLDIIDLTSYLQENMNTSSSASSSSPIDQHSITQELSSTTTPSIPTSVTHHHELEHQNSDLSEETVTIATPLTTPTTTSNTTHAMPSDKSETNGKDFLITKNARNDTSESNLLKKTTSGTFPSDSDSSDGTNSKNLPWYYKYPALRPLARFFEPSPPPPVLGGPLPERKANYFSRMTIYWIQEFMATGYKRPLTEEDLFVLDGDLSAEHSDRRLGEAWIKECEKVKKFNEEIEKGGEGGGKEKKKKEVPSLLRTIFSVSL